jgi:hypothetical protein
MDETKKMIKGIFRSQRISSCVFSSDDFKKLYHLLAEKANEAAEIVRQEFKEQEKILSPEQQGNFKERKERLPEALKLVAYVTGSKGERVVFTEESMISSETMPEDVQTITILSAFAYYSAFGVDPRNKFEVWLNFTKPRLLDFSDRWSLPSEGKNSIQVEGNNETWVNGVYKSIVDFFESKVKKRNWLHARLTWDLFLWLLGVPAIFWTIFRLDDFIRSAMPPFSTVLLVAIYMYVFLLGFVLARLIFNYALWTFPQYEYQTEKGSKPGKHRYVFWVLLSGAGGGFLQDFVRYLFKHLL